MTDYLRRGSPDYRRATIGLFCAGFSSFAMLYCVQPLLPLLARAFHQSASGASWAVSAATTGVACSLLVVGAVSDRIGRKSLMGASLFAVVIFNLLATVSPTWGLVLLCRFLSGVAMSGVPAVAMAYLAEEVAPDSLGGAMGLYVGANAIGGLAGRLLVGALADATGSWRIAFAGMGVLGLVTAAVFLHFLPPSRRFQPAPQSRLAPYLKSVLALFADPGLPWLLAVGFILLSVFVTLFDLMAFRLAAPPFSLSSSAMAAVFLVYLIGAPVSGWFGRMGDRYGKAVLMAVGLISTLLGLAATLIDNLFGVVVGLCLATCGYFGAHAQASAWTTVRAPQARGQASALYLQFLYLGPMLIGTMGGEAWAHEGWTGVVLVLMAWAAAALAVVRFSPLWRMSKDISQLR